MPGKVQSKYSFQSLTGGDPNCERSFEVSGQTR
jgi:hypothetical protein